MTDALDLLWPPPRRVERTGAGCTLAAAAVEVAPAVRTPGLVASGYRLEVAATGARIEAGDDTGERHARATLRQLADLTRRPDGTSALPGVRIDDAPAFRVRGAMLDVSRSRVPRTHELLRLAERLAAWKLGELQLYVEHAFAYRGHEEVWRDASPLTPDDVRALDDRCAALGVELVPNQQSFGHFHRWLKHARYRGLAEVLEGVTHAFSLEREPYSLCLGDPRAIALLEDLYDQLLPCFRSRSFNVGLDETFDLGQGRSKAACDERGVERVYLEYLRDVHALVTARGHRMQFWGDVIVKRPELVPELPKDLVALEWGYDAGHPFAEHVGHFAQSGLEFRVCPGTSSWQSFAGRVDNALANQREAAVHGARAGASGYLVTDWGDRGHHQPDCVREWGLFAAAGPAWNPETVLDAPKLARLLDAHVYQDAAGELGAAAVELGNAYLATGSPATNGTALFFLVAFAPERFPHLRTPLLTRAGLFAAKEQVERAVARLDRARSARPDAAQVIAEMRWVGDALRLAADLGLARLDAGEGVPLEGLPQGARSELAARFRDLEAGHARIWLARDREGGLAESLHWLARVRLALEGDQ